MLRCLIRVRLHYPIRLADAQQGTALENCRSARYAACSLLQWPAAFHSSYIRFVCDCSLRRTHRATRFGAKCSKDRVPAICVTSPSTIRAAAVEVS